MTPRGFAEGRHARGNVVRGDAGSRSSVRWLAVCVALIIGLAACSSGDDDGGGGASGDDDNTDTTSGVPEGEITELEVDRTSRFAQARHVLRAGDRGAGGGAEATDDGITADVDLDHAHPRHARRPRGPRLRDPDRRSGRPGGEVRRTHQRSLRRHPRSQARADPRRGATDRARGSGPGRGRPGRVHRGDRRQQGRVRVLRQRLGRPRRRVVRHRRPRHRSTSRRTTSRQEDLAGADNRLYSIDAVVGRRARVPRPHAREQGRSRARPSAS